MNKPLAYVLVSSVLLVIVTIVAIVIARGYFPDLTSRTLIPTGILVATSDPDGAQVYIQGRLTNATNTTINLAPNVYDIRIAKDGFSPWEKKVTIKREEVIKTNVFLFPQVPDLRPLTLTGVANPEPSPDRRKIVYTIASASAEKTGIWVLDLDSSRSVLWGHDTKQISKQPLGRLDQPVKFVWSPDSKDVLAYIPGQKEDPEGTKLQLDTSVASPSANPYLHFAGQHQTTIAYFLESNKTNLNPPYLSGETLATLLSSWAQVWEEKTRLNLSKLPLPISNFFQTNANAIFLSPDATKLLYTASSSAVIPKFLDYYLPGVNPTQETRELLPNRTYVYDIKEDKNYLIADQGPTPNFQINWFPSSRHLLIDSPKSIAAVEYDGTNKAALYTGPFLPGLVVPWPNWSKIVIATSLNDLSGGVNLYTLILR